MKKFLLFTIALFTVLLIRAQDTVYFENFNTVPLGQVPSGWNVSSNTNVDDYDRPALAGACTIDYGLQTPGVGKGAPVRLILPTMIYNEDNPIVIIRFKVFVYDASLKCATLKPFPCPTFVNTMLIKSTYSGGTNQLPADGDIYQNQNYEIKQANGDNTVIFEPNLPDGTPYRIYFDFKTAENTGCVSTGTKFIFDDFNIGEFDCFGDCPPVANDDYFDASTQGFQNSLKANVYGGFLKWSDAISKDYAMKSLDISPAVNNGLDYDADNHELASMQFLLITGPTVENYQYCPGTPPVGTLNLNMDGTFDYTRGDGCVTRVSFIYQVVDPTGLRDTAKVWIDFPPNSPLPVTFSEFTAVRNKTRVAVKWQTSTEMNNKGFYVQCNTGNGWNSKAFVFSAANDGYSTAPLNYSFNDLNNFPGVSQYRIAQVDIDGAVKYSNIQLVNSEQAAGQVHVYPNPSATGMVNVILPHQGNFDLALFDLSGRKLKEWKQVKESNLPIDRLTQGTYILRVTDIEAGRTQSVRLLITR